MKGHGGMEAYRVRKNSHSIDVLPGVGLLQECVSSGGGQPLCPVVPRRVDGYEFGKRLDGADDDFDYLPDSGADGGPSLLARDMRPWASYRRLKSSGGMIRR